MYPAYPIHRYGIHLRPMADGDVETVRIWRNAEHVRNKMEFQALISKEMQEKWWQELDLGINYYYIIEQAGRGVGVIHAKDIDWVMRTAETGIFIGEEAVLNSFVPVLAVLALMDELFEGGFYCLHAKVIADSPKIADFNRRLGYQVISEEGGFLRLHVERDAYFEVAAPLRAMAAKMF